MITYLLFISKLKFNCYLAPPIGKLPKLNDLIGAKSIDGFFYRAKVVKKVNDVSYNVQLIDYGTEENVNLSNIVSLSSEIKKVCILIQNEIIYFDSCFCFILLYVNE